MFWAASPRILIPLHHSSAELILNLIWKGEKGEAISGLNGCNKVVGGFRITEELL